jgi:gas vesicle protein
MKNSVSGIITAFLAGAAVGALVGILYAPEKGSVTRSRLKAVGEELGEDLADSFETIKKEFTGEDEAAEKKTGRTGRGRKRSAKNAEE